MNRAEQRRMEKAKKKAKTTTYNLTPEQLDMIFEAKFQAKIDEVKEQATLDAVDISMVMVSNISLKVLKDHFWKKTYDKKLHEFMDLFVDEYLKCQNNETYILDLQEEMKDYNVIKFVKEE